MAACKCIQNMEESVREIIQKQIKRSVLSVTYKSNSYKFAVRYEGIERPRTITMLSNPDVCPICGKRREAGSKKKEQKR